MDTQALDSRILAVAEDCVAGFHRRPFAAVAAACGVDEDVVIARLLALLEQGRVRRVRQTLLSTSLAEGALVAWKLPEKALEAAFDWLAGHDPFTGHIVIRRADPPAAPGADFRLWTTLKVPRGCGSVREHCRILARHIGARDWVVMPVVGMFTLGVGHTRRAQLPPGGRTPEPPRMQEPRQLQLDRDDWRVLLSLKESLEPGEFVPCPWEARAAAIGMDAEKYCRIAESLDARGAIGRFAAFLDHRGAADTHAGTGHAALFLWAVPQGMEERAGAAIGSHTCMTHCYWRSGGGKVFGGAQIMGVAHAATQETLDAHKAAMDAYLAEQGIPLLHTAAFRSVRAEIRPSEISPAAYADWLARHGRKRSRRWFLKGLAGAGALTAAGFGVDWLLPRTLCRPGEWHGPAGNHFDGTRFFNPEPHRPYTAGNLASWCRDRFSKGEYPDVAERRFTPQLAPAVDGKAWEATLVNHSTFLLRLAGLNILTDPVWSDFTSPVLGLGPKRHRPVGIAWDELPSIDVCLLTHDHYDHFDVPTLRRLRERDNPQFIVPLGLKSLLEHHCGTCRVAERDWWDTVECGALRITLTPAHHWSNRYRTEHTRNRSLWCGFWLQAAGGPKVYFSGDSARSRCFARIHERLGAPDVAILPIGQYRPEWIRQNHTSPADAVEAFLTLHARMGIACHFGTWQLANEGYQETLDDLAAALRAHGVAPARFPAPDNGQTLRG